MRERRTDPPTHGRTRLGYAAVEHTSDTRALLARRLTPTAHPTQLAAAGRGRALEGYCQHDRGLAALMKRGELNATGILASPETVRSAPPTPTRRLPAGRTRSRRWRRSRSATPEVDPPHKL